MNHHSQPDQQNQKNNQRPATGSPIDPALKTSVAVSGALHVTLAATLALLLTFGQGASEKIEIEVIENPKLNEAPQLNLADQPRPAPPPPTQPARKVFGVAKNAITSDEPGPGVSVKQGNTVATAPDDLKLNDSDANSLPIPTDEYLVSKMPSVLADVVIPYPPEARAAKISGKVVLELLIDASGAIRSARVLSEPGYGLGDAALKAITRFRFRAAEVDGKPVAVKIPFTYNFVLTSE